LSERGRPRPPRRKEPPPGLLDLSKVIDRWKKELEHLNNKEEQILMQRRIDLYLDQKYGSCYLKDPYIGAMVEESLLDRDGMPSCPQSE
jgi:hypothetical protein